MPHARLLAAAALPAMLAAAPAHAQTTAAAAPAAEADAGEIVVTARRQSESLREVPASVSVVTAATIEAAQIRTATDFVALTPGVSLVANTAEAGDNQLNIRGINSARDAESSVALVVDGILKTNTAVLNQDQGAVRQIEILKGPQGALYGRNAAAGAIVITTLRPGGALEGQVLASAANNNTYRGAAYVAAPLSPGVGVVLSGDWFTTDGFYRNDFLGAKVVDDREAWNLNGRLVAEAGPATRIDAKLRYGRQYGASIAFNPVFALPNFTALNPAFYEDVNTHPFRFVGNIRPENRQKGFEASLKIDHDFDGATLSAWTLFSDVRNFLTADGTAGDFARYSLPTGNTPAAAASAQACAQTTAALTGYPLSPPAFLGRLSVPSLFNPQGSLYGAYSPTTCDGTQYQQRDQRDVSAEIRLASNDPAAAVSWQLGAYYLNIRRETAVSLGADLGRGIIKAPYAGPSSGNPTSQLYWDRFGTNVYAAFGALDWRASDTLKLGLAARFDREDRDVTNLVPAVLDPITGGTINPGQRVVNGQVQPIAPQQARFEQLQPKVSLAWTPTRAFTAFANWGVGFKSGGFNNSGSAALVNANFNTPPINAGVRIDDQFRKERSSAFEAGVKGAAGGGTFTYELAGYRTRVRDMQFFEFLVGGFGLLRTVSNIDRVDITGVEGAVTLRPVEGLRLFASANVTDSEIKANRSRPDTVGNKSPYTPDYTLNAGAQLDIPVGLFEGTLRLDWRRTGPTWFHTVQDQERPTIFTALVPLVGLPAALGTARYDLARRDAYDIVNLRVGLQAGAVRVTAFATNLLKERYVEEVIPAAEFGGSFVSPGALRTFGVEAALRF